MPLELIPRYKVYPGIMDKQTNLTIGQVAKLANVNTQTLRYYERRKILSPDICRAPALNSSEVFGVFTFASFAT